MEAEQSTVCERLNRQARMVEKSEYGDRLNLVARIAADGRAENCFLRLSGKSEGNHQGEVLQSRLRLFPMRKSQHSH